jgi:CheY-like chemotaxis protein
MSKEILLVDNIGNTLSVTGFTLEQTGYKVHKASSAQEALRILKSDNNIQLIVTDYNMPRMNRLQFATEINSYFAHNSMPIFILSSETKDGKQKVAGISLWIRKPFKTEKLLEFVRRCNHGIQMEYYGY